MNSPTVIPAALETLFIKTVSERTYPPEVFPREWFPDLMSIVGELFKVTWKTDPTFRNDLTAADESRAAEMIDAELSLPAILARHPRTLLLLYQPLISGFIRRLHRRPEERQDIIQEIFCRLLAGKLDRIEIKFDADFKQSPNFTSYFMVCVRNMYVDIVREGRNLLMQKDEVPLPVLEMITSTRCQTGQDILLEEEFAKLRAILRLHPSSRGRMEMCLKLKCRLALTRGDARRCFPGCSADDIQKLSADFRHMKDRDMYRAIVPVFNRHESKSIQADTLRKWVENRTHLLVTHLNRLHGGTVYDSDNISDLLTLFFTAANDHESE